MKRTPWIFGAMTAFALAACGERNAGDDAGTMGGAETGTPGMTADTIPAGGAMDTALTDTAPTMGDTTAN